MLPCSRWDCICFAGCFHSRWVHTKHSSTLQVLFGFKYTWRILCLLLKMRVHTECQSALLSKWCVHQITLQNTTWKPNIDSLNMQPQRVKIVWALLFVLFMLLRQRSLMFQQGFLVVSVREAFRIAERSRRRLVMCLIGQMQLQNRHLQRRAWAWPRPQNWFRVLFLLLSNLYIASSPCFESSPRSSCFVSSRLGNFAVSVRGGLRWTFGWNV